MTRGPDKQFDRDEALRKAMQLFWNQGYEATGVSELLTHMGIGRQSLYDTFGSKRELFLEALRGYFGDRRAEAGRAFRSAGSTLGGVRALFDELRRQHEELGPFGCMLGNAVAENAAHDPELAAALRSFFDEMKGLLAGALRAGQQSGEIRADLAPEAMASALVVTLQGAALFSRIEADMQTSRAAFESLLACLKPA